jgi:hypothetical protein
LDEIGVTEYRDEYSAIRIKQIFFVGKIKVLQTRPDNLKFNIIKTLKIGIKDMFSM